MKVACIGHIPQELSIWSDYRPVILPYLVSICDDLLYKLNATEVISGFAYGFETAIGLSALGLGIRLKSAIPYKGLGTNWPAEDRKLLGKLTSLSEVRYESSNQYSTYAVHKKNIWMIDYCDHLLVLWDGRQGEIKDSLDYAVKINKPFTNVWEIYANRHA